MAIDVHTFELSVTCTKMVDRDNDDGIAARYQDAERQIDLTPFLGDAGAVRTVKDLDQCSGAFELSFADQMDFATQDSLYARIEPMDMIEIRASRFPADFVGGDLPIIMRGFVDTVRRSEVIGDDGQPRRAVIVTGHDFGKLWEIHQVFWELAIYQEKPMLTAFGLQAALGIEVDMQDIADFIRTFVDKVMNLRIAELEAFSRQIVQRFSTDATVKLGQVIPSRLGEIPEANYWSIISAFADRPWNELFIRDEENGPHLVFREVPYRNLAGAFIMPDATDPGTVEVNEIELIQIDVGRSDARVANFFWTPPGSASLDTSQRAVAGSIIDGSALDFKHGNNLPELYGERKMQVPTGLQPSDVSNLPTRLPADQQQNEAGKYIPWYRLRAMQLQAINRDNSVLEDGGAVVMGREDHQIGRYLRITRGDVTSESYVRSVRHTIQPLSIWTTSLQLERGTGFLNRLKVSGSPYLAEGRRGAYS